MNDITLTAKRVTGPGQVKGGDTLLVDWYGAYTAYLGVKGVDDHGMNTEAVWLSKGQHFMVRALIEGTSWVRAAYILPDPKEVAQ